MHFSIRTLAAALCVAGLTGAPAMAQNATPFGTWELSGGESRFEVFACGDGSELCARMTWLRDDARTDENLPYLGQNVLEGAQVAGVNTWSGTVHYDGDSYDGRLTLVDGENMRLQGCVGIFCRSMELERI